MNKTGFSITGIRACGIGKSDAEVQFHPGLNIVTGPSDTGKSFLFQAIDFLLGAKNRPKHDFPEASDYASLYLGIHTVSGEEFVLQRQILTGDAEVVQGSFSAVDSWGDAHEVKQRAGGQNESISSILMSPTGLSDKKLRKNVRGEKQTLSFRHIAWLTAIPEGEILSESPLVELKGPTLRTVWRSTLRLLLTGIDDAQAQETEKAEIRKAKLLAQFDIMSRLIGEREERLQRLESDTPVSIEEREKVASLIANVTEETENVRAEIETENARLREAATELRKVDAGLRTTGDMLARFELLHESYETDLKRLKAIEEAGCFFSYLPRKACPTCGTELSKIKKSIEDRDDNVEFLVQAAATERAKVRNLRDELYLTSKNARQEQETLKNRQTERQNAYNTASQKIRDILKPQLDTTGTHLRELLSKKEKIDVVLVIRDGISDLQKRLDQIDSKLAKPAPKTPEPPGTPNFELHKLCQVVKKTLKRWAYPNIETVEWDDKLGDIRINGQARTSHGKGHRAFMFSAFVIGLMRYCRSNNLPHPGVVVLDSPLVTLRETDPADEGIRPDMKDAFFIDLASNTGDDQVIIMENDEPPAHIVNQINLIRFTGDPETPRTGFFPPVQE